MPQQWIFGLVSYCPKLTVSYHALSTLYCFIFYLIIVLFGLIIILFGLLYGLKRKALIFKRKAHNPQPHLLSPIVHQTFWRGKQKQVWWVKVEEICSSFGRLWQRDKLSWIHVWCRCNSYIFGEIRLKDRGKGLWFKGWLLVMCFSWKLRLLVEIVGGYGFLGSWEREVEDQIKLFVVLWFRILN